MSTPEERIRDLARKNAIDEVAAARLLAAVRPAPGATEQAAGWNPFERWRPEVGAALGVVASAALVGLSRLHIRTPGTLDLQHTDRPISFAQATLDQGVAFVLTAAVFWAIGRGFAKHVRPIDVLATVGLARVPAAILAVPLALLGPGSEPVKRGPVLYLLMLLALLAIGVQVTLLVLGFRTATGLRGARLTVGFLCALLGAEILSKIVLALV